VYAGSVFVEFSIMRTLVAVVVVCTGISTELASAVGDDSALKLPKVGAWARYHASTTRDTGDEALATMILKSLTATEIDGVACRWLESEYFVRDDENHERRKLLIPEETIRTSEKPSDEVLRYLQRDGTAAVASVPPENEGWMPIDFLYFPGFLKSARQVDDPRTVKHQTGTLEISKAYVGTYKWCRKGRDPDKTTAWETEYRVWLHADLPMGFAHAQAKLRVLSEGREVRSWRMEYALQEFGANPQPAIVEESAPPIKP
jgi:hypothetical protein